VIQPLQYDRETGTLFLLDQTLLPDEERYKNIGRTYRSYKGFEGQRKSLHSSGKNCGEEWTYWLTQGLLP